MNTENTVVRTESMTLRVWRARIESVVFGKDEARQVTAMFSTEREAKALSAHLQQFARSQSVLVAPVSAEDQARIALLNAGEHSLAGPSGGDALAALERPATPAVAAGAGAAVHCTQCGTRAAMQARFCAECGTAL